MLLKYCLMQLLNTLGIIDKLYKYRKFSQTIHWICLVKAISQID